MPTSKTISYPDALFLPALIQRIDNAQSSVQIMTFLFKTSYVGETGAKQVKEACKRAAVLGHPRYHACRRYVIDFLECHAHQSRPSALDSVLKCR